MKKALSKKFFNRPAPEVARDLLGKYLVRKVGSKIVSLMITETEAYEGLDDLASHASKGRTPRTEIMFGEPGRFYIYLIYGMYHMLNIVTGKKGHPAAVLIRGLEGMKGPGVVTRELGINKALNNFQATPESGLWFEDRGVKVSTEDVKLTPRIGIDYAGPIWSQIEWRFVYAPPKL